MNNDSNIEKTDKHYWLYILKLESDKYYVGITARANPQTRINQHISGFYGAKWTKRYKYISTVEVRDLGVITLLAAEREEKRVTIEYMDRFGYQNVRGADLSYSGKYVKRFNRFFTEDNWEVLTLVSLQTLIIVYLMIDKYFL